MERQYGWSLDSLLRHAKDLGKGLDEVIDDLKRRIK